MSRWYLTSSLLAHERASRACSIAALTPAGECETECFYGQTYQKRADPVATFTRRGEQDWVFCAGTLIYAGRTGTGALTALHADYLLHGIEYVQSTAIGHYALAMGHGVSLTMFTDPQASITLFYAQEGADWFVATSLQLFGQVGFAGPVDRDRLLITALETTTQGDRTFYSGVRRLFGSQAICIDMSSRVFEVRGVRTEEPSADWASLDLEDAAERYLTDIRMVFGQLISVGPIGLLGTGGLDSRTVLAGLLDQGASPTMLYGTSNNSLVDHNPRDLAVARELAGEFGLPFVSLDWTGRQPHPEGVLRALFGRYGFQYEIYGAPDQLLTGFENGLTSNARLFMGGYSPAFTNHKPWDFPGSRFTFADLLAFTMAPVATDTRMLCSKDYVDTHASDVRTALRRRGIQFPDDGSAATLGEFVEASLALGFWAGDRFINFANEFVQYIAPFHLKPLYDPLMMVKPEIRSRDKFQVRVLHRLAPKLLALPLYSAYLPSTINYRTWEMTQSQELSSLLARSVDLVLPRVARRTVKRFGLRLLHSRLAQEKNRDAEIRDAYAEAVLSDPVVAGCFTDVRYMHLKMIQRLRHYLIGIHADQD